MIELRPFERSDSARLISWVKTPEFLLQWAGPAFSHPLDELQLESHLQASEGSRPLRRIFKAVDTGTGSVVGHIELDRIDRHNRSATVSRVLVGEPAARGKGLGAEMVRQILGIAFGELGLHRISLLVFDFNAAAIACYVNVGFIIEGRLRDARRSGDDYWSEYQMSILESEWRSRRT
ncbi:MAG TPA: GNAT family protein [Candidatus Acidoferrum sp.]|nr:GNAT family protein [Candidatus Acidoferrum sp.]